MKKTRVAILVLALALVGSNAWWANRALDTGVIATYREASLREYREALAQTFAIIPVAARPGATPAQVLEAAKRAAPGAEAFENDGFTCIGQIGLHFDENGRLVEVKALWNPF